MSGGGGKVSKGRMGSSVVVEIDPKELQALEKNLEKVMSFSELNIYLSSLPLPPPKKK